MPPLVRLADIATITQGLNRSGQGAGARSGDWEVRLVSVGTIHDDRLRLDEAEAAAIEQNVKTQKYLLYPHDLLLTARSTLFKAAIVPPPPSPTVADATLFIVRPHDPA